MRTKSHLLALVLIGATASLQAGSRTETRATADLTPYRTYAWIAGSPATREISENRIVAAVDAALQSKGLVRVEGHADLDVSTHVLVERHRLDDLDDDEYRGYWRGVVSVDAFDVAAGTLVIDLADPRREQTVWRGVASSSVKGSVKKNLRGIDRIVTKLFKNYPAR